jgi:large subunit ribosomal protein L10
MKANSKGQTSSPTTNMALTKQQKEKSIIDLKDKISKQKVMLLVAIAGLKVKDVSKLRNELKKVDANLKVVKKTLAEKALKENKISFDKSKFKEEIAFIFGFQDEISPAKTAYQFSKENEKLKILGGFLEGEFKNDQEMINLAQLLSKPELLAKLVGTLSAPMSNLVYDLNYNIKGLITILSKIKT